MTKAIETLRRVLESQLDLQQLSAHYPPERIVDGQGVRPHVTIDGQDFLVFSSNDYLDLACDPRVIAAANLATETYGVGALPSRMTTGTLDVHKKLESRLASFMCAESSLAFTSGMLTNIGTIPSIICSPLAQLLDWEKAPVSRAVFADEGIHASLIDGIKLARPDHVRFYRHGDADFLARLLRRSKHDLKLIVTDGVFSVHGDIAPLQDIVRLAEEHDAVVMVDDAHGIGVLGDHGRGACELLGVEDHIAVRMGVISKALGCIGGFIAAPSWFIEYLRHAARTNMFSMAVPAAAAAAVITAVDIVEKEPWRRQQLLQNADCLRAGAQSLGFDTLSSTTHIIPLFIGDDRKAEAIAGFLHQRRILAPAIRWPAAPKGKAVIRLFANTAHTRSDMDYFLESLGAATTSDGP